MGHISYEPLIRDMTWSYSRIKTFDDCPYKWFLRYIKLADGERYPRKELFFSSYGILMHELLASYHNGIKSAEQLTHEFLQTFRNRIREAAPNETVFKNYLAGGLAYLRGLTPSVSKPLSVESKAEFSIDSMPFVGYIDLLEESQFGELLLIDHKSKNLKPRSNRKTPTKSDKELDEYLKQLYLYAHFVYIQHGRFPDRLCFNCFRKNLLIWEPFNKDAYHMAIIWFLEKIEEICAEEDFRPDIEFFKCRYLCEMQDYCEYYKLSKG